MQEFINKLAELFRQRNQIDDLIVNTLGFMHAVEEEAKKPEPKPKRTRKTGRVKTYKQSGRKPKFDPDFIDQAVYGEDGKRYRCEECDNIFNSTADYLDVSCPECGARKVISLPL